MWPEIIGSVATGLTGLVVAVAGLLAARSRGASDELAVCRRERRMQQQQLTSAIRHVARLERLLANTGANVPPRPDVLRELVS